MDTITESPTPTAPSLEQWRAETRLGLPAVPPPSAEELLIEECAQWVAMDREWRRMLKAVKTESGQAVADAVMDAQCDLMRKIAQMPAKTPAGIKAKANTLVAYHRKLENDFPAGFSHNDLLRSLIQDAIALTA